MVVQDDVQAQIYYLTWGSPDDQVFFTKLLKK